MSPSPYGLRISAALVIGFGALMILGVIPVFHGLLGALADVILWPLDGAETLDAPITRLLAAICGGLAVGWGVSIWGLGGPVFQAAPEAVRTLVLRGYLAWFLADGLASVIAGAPLNLIGNACFLAALWWPIRTPFAKA